MSEPKASVIYDSVQAYYEFYVSEAAKTPECPAMADWKDLDHEQVTAWAAAFAATVEVTHRIATALMMVTP